MGGTAAGAMNIFRFLGDLSHIVSFLVLLHKIIKGKSSAGISLRTQELYAVVFCSRYVDLLWNFSSMYNWILKIGFIGASVAIVYLEAVAILPQHFLLQKLGEVENL